VVVREETLALDGGGSWVLDFPGILFTPLELWVRFLKRVGTLGRALGMERVVAQTCTVGHAIVLHD
jgi:hypothetical protein